jgi:hypothetical protein
MKMDIHGVRLQRYPPPHADGTSKGPQLERGPDLPQSLEPEENAKVHCSLLNSDVRSI